MSKNKNRFVWFPVEMFVLKFPEPKLMVFKNVCLYSCCHCVNPQASATSSRPMLLMFAKITEFQVRFCFEKCIKYTPNLARVPSFAQIYRVYLNKNPVYLLLSRS